MSLKAFHIFFVTVSILFAIGFAGWCFHNYSEQKLGRDLVFGILSLLAGLGLLLYGRAVLRKLKNVSYL